MSRLEGAMLYLVDLFQDYACRDGDKYHLSKREMKEVFNSQCTQILKDSWNFQRVAEIMAGMDKDSDGQVDFEEFVSMAAKLIMCSSNYFKDNCGATPRCGVRP